MVVRVAVVQPKSFTAEREAENVGRAVSYLEDAAGKGAAVVCFPELYPGPANPQNEFGTDVLYETAKRLSIFVIRGKLESAGSDRYFICVELVGPDGKSVGTYRRTTPSGPYVYFDIDAWNFNYIPSDQIPVFDTDIGKIAALVCSEVYVPELSRILALKGAEIVFYPAGGLINELMPTWKTMIRARAVENLMYTAASQSLYGVEPGVAMITGPERVLAECDEECVLTADLDLDRIRWLRSETEKIEMPKQYRVIPGTLQWRRPDLYRSNYRDW